MNQAYADALALIKVRDRRIRDLETDAIQSPFVRQPQYDDLENRVRKYEAAMREIADGFIPDGTYVGRPIYEIATECL